MKLKMLTGAAAIAALVGTPAVAQQTERLAGQQQQWSGGTTGASGQRMQSRAQYGQSRGYNDGRRSGVAPVDAAAGVAGGAVGTAGAIATAPVTPSRSDSYAYERQTTTTMPRAQRRADSTRSMRGQYRDSQAYYGNQRGSGFAPVDAAAGVVGGAVGTAGAIATAPFRSSRSDSYAYYRDDTSMPRARYRDSQAYYGNQRGSGFAPLDAAAGVVGGAVGTAAAIATAPLAPFTNTGYGYRDTYAYSPGVGTNRSYIADYNGPYCAPGSFVMMDGEPVPCQ